jgi:hypothetical protein
VVVGGVGRGARGGALGAPVGDEAVEAGSQLSPGRRGGEAAIEVGDRGRRPDRRDRVVGQRAGRRGRGRSVAAALVQYTPPAIAPIANAAATPTRS